MNIIILTLSYTRLIFDSSNRVFVWHVFVCATANHTLVDARINRYVCACVRYQFLLSDAAACDGWSVSSQSAFLELFRCPLVFVFNKNKKRRRRREVDVCILNSIRRNVCPVAHMNMFILIGVHYSLSQFQENQFTNCHVIKCRLRTSIIICINTSFHSLWFDRVHFVLSSNNGEP